MVRAHRLKQYAPPQGDTSPPPCRLKSSASRGCGSVRHARRQEGHGLVRLCRCTAAAWLCQRGPDAGAGAGAGAGACSSARNAQHGDGAGGDGCKTVMRDRLEARKLCFPTLVGRAGAIPGPPTLDTGVVQQARSIRRRVLEPLLDQPSVQAYHLSVAVSSIYLPWDRIRGSANSYLIS